MTRSVGRFTTFVVLMVFALPAAAGAQGFHITDADLGLAWRVALAVSMLLFTCSVADAYLAQRRIPPDLRTAAEAFVNAFAKPLIDPGSRVAPIRARLRFVPEMEQLEILIAPNSGRRYPNLGDHRSNVEYDIRRVARLLRAHVVVSDGLRAEGPWVVVPIRSVDSKQAGGK